MNARHTPGPWHVCDEHEASHRWVIAQPDGSSVADCCPAGPWVPDEEADANASLIAAAPDLLDLANDIVSNVILAGTEIGQRAQELIAKATGATP